MDLAALRTQQQQLAASVERADRLDRDPPALIGGADVGFEQEGEITRAAMVLLTWPELELVEYQVARVATSMPYIPGFLSFRETPALLAAWEQLSQKPDLLFVDGHGISHPRRLGVASHFGLMIDVPTIGVAKKRLCGKIGDLGDEPGAAAAASVPATLTPSTLSTTAPTRCWTARWPSMPPPSAQAAPASMWHWCRTSAPTATATARTMLPSCRISASLHPLIRWRWIRPAPMPA